MQGRDHAVGAFPALTSAPVLVPVLVLVLVLALGLVGCSGDGPGAARTPAPSPPGGIALAFSQLRVSQGTGRPLPLVAYF